MKSTNKIELSLIIDDDNKTQLELDVNNTSDEKIKQICHNLCIKYELPHILKNKLFFKISREMSRIKKVIEKEEILEKGKMETVNRLYYDSINHNKKKDLKMEILRKEKMENKSNFSFTPQINKKSNLLYDRKFYKIEDRLYYQHNYLKEKRNYERLVTEVANTQRSNSSGKYRAVQTSPGKSNNLSTNNNIFSYNSTSNNEELKDLSNKKYLKKTSSTLKTLKESFNENKFKNVINNVELKSTKNLNTLNRYSSDENVIQTPAFSIRPEIKHPLIPHQKSTFMIRNDNKNEKELYPSNEEKNENLLNVNLSEISNISNKNNNPYNQIINVNSTSTSPSNLITLKKKNSIKSIQSSNGYTYSEKYDKKLNKKTNNLTPYFISHINENIDKNTPKIIINSPNDKIFLENSNSFKDNLNNLNSNPISINHSININKEDKLYSTNNDKNSHNLKKFNINNEKNNLFDKRSRSQTTKNEVKVFTKSMNPSLDRLYKVNQQVENRKKEMLQRQMQKECPFQPKLTSETKNLLSKIRKPEDKETFLNRLTNSKKINSISHLGEMVTKINSKRNSKSQSSRTFLSTVNNNTERFENKENIENLPINTHPNKVDRKSTFSTSEYQTPKNCFTSINISTDRRRLETQNSLRIREIKNVNNIYGSLNQIKNTRNKQNKIVQEKFTENINKFKLNNLKELYETVTQKNQTEFESIPQHIREKLLIPTCAIIKKKGIDFNFQNFYNVASEIMNNFF